jgi:uncharacterized protein
MKKILYILPIVWFAVQAQAQSIPEPPHPPRLVNDLAHVLTAGQANRLEFELDTFARSTTTQIVVVTVPSLGGYDIADYSFKLGEKWGIGQKGKNNGVIIVFKPKTEREPGRAFVAVGYGLEGVIPDATANRIVDREMIPHFKDGDIYGGLLQGCKVIMSLAGKEFTAQEYEEKSDEAGGLIAVFVLFIIFMIVISIATKSRNKNFTIGDSKGSLPFWLLMSMLNNSGRSNNKDWDDFTRGSGGFRGFGGSSGGGGFGGFGGGSFGGGGAGGSW